MTSHNFNMINEPPKNYSASFFNRNFYSGLQGLKATPGDVQLVCDGGIGNVALCTPAQGYIFKKLFWNQR